MLRGIFRRIVYALNQMGRFNREQRMLLDDGSSCCYTITAQETDVVKQSEVVWETRHAALVDKANNRDLARKTGTINAVPPLSNAPLTPEMLRAVLDTFDEALSHTHYAVCGHAALLVWGYRPDSVAAAEMAASRGTTTTTTAAAAVAVAAAEAAKARMPAHVSIVCPAAGRQAILASARTVGWAVYAPGSVRVVVSASSASSVASPVPLPTPPPSPPTTPSPAPPPSSSPSLSSSPRLASSSSWKSTAAGAGGDSIDEVIGVPLPGSSPAMAVGFRLRTVEDAVWNRLGKVRPRDAGLPYASWTRQEEEEGPEDEGMRGIRAQVLAVPTLLDEIARAWYSCAVRREEVGSDRERYIAGLIFWFLRRLAEDNTRRAGRTVRWKPLTPRHVPNLTCRKFWNAFVGQYRDARGLLASCGLYPVPDAAEEAHERGRPKVSPPNSLVQLLRRLDSSRPSRRLRQELCCDVQ
ncbi:hypothetical protein VTH82DRAFT_3267 [Thermothelomyces myriococcoides]